MSENVDSAPRPVTLAELGLARDAALKCIEAARSLQQWASSFPDYEPGTGLDHLDQMERWFLNGADVYGVAQEAMEEWDAAMTPAVRRWLVAVNADPSRMVHVHGYVDPIAHDAAKWSSLPYLTEFTALFRVLEPLTERGMDAIATPDGFRDLVQLLVEFAGHCKHIDLAGIETVVATIEAEWAAAIRATPTQSKAVPSVRLSGAEQDIIEVIREIGPSGDRSQTAILDALASKGKVVSPGTTKVILASLVRHGILRKGYRLPEWG